ncbi:MAG: hypothetical protein HY791_16325 [Deltaproteobacteria bacterium]|nr:hypothetical protein [Deltaproteobacteria bacterium]
MSRSDHGRGFAARPDVVGVWCLFSSVACGPASTRIVMSGDLDFEVGFVVELDANGQVRNLSRSFGIAGGALAYGRPTLELSSEHAEVLLLGISARDLQAVSPGYDSSRRSSVALSLGHETSTSPYDDPIIASVPASARVWRVDESATLAESSLSEQAALAELTLVVPSNPEFCGTSLASARPFGATAELFGGPGPWESSPTLIFIAPVSAERVVIGTRYVVAMVEPGGSASTQRSGPPFETIDFRRVSLPNISVARIHAVVPNPPGDRVFVAGTTSPEGGFLMELDVRADGLWPVRTVTAAVGVSSIPSLNHLAIDLDGTVVAVGDIARGETVDPAALIIREPQHAEFRPVSIPVDPAMEELTQIAFTGDEQTPALVGFHGESLFEGDPRSGEWQLTSLGAPLTDGPEVRCLAADGVERWAAGNDGLLSRWTAGSGWQRFVPRLPPSTDPCTLGIPFEATPGVSLSLGLGPRWVSVVFAACSLVVLFDRQRECTASVVLPGVPAERAPGVVEVAVQAGNVLFVGGRRGLLFTVPLGPSENEGR